MAVQRLVLQRHVLAHRATAVAHDLRPGVGIVLLDHAGRARLLDGVLEHVALDLLRRVLLGEDVVDELHLVGTPRHIGVQCQRTRSAAVHARREDEQHQHVREHAADLGRDGRQHLDLLGRQVAVPVVSEQL